MLALEEMRTRLTDEREVARHRQMVMFTIIALILTAVGVLLGIIAWRMPVASPAPNQTAATPR